MNIFAPAQELALLGCNLFQICLVRAKCLIQNISHRLTALREILLIIFSRHFLLILEFIWSYFFEIQRVLVRLGTFDDVDLCAQFLVVLFHDERLRDLLV